jgi:hypothetical protein
MTRLLQPSQGHFYWNVKTVLYKFTFASFEVTYQIEISCQFMKVGVLIPKIIFLTRTGPAPVL